jgi:putative protein-disulfide isomerase
MGGLRPGTTEPMAEAARRALVQRWREIGELAGVPFGDALEREEGFVYDTDPAARACVLARRTSNEDALDFLEQAHRAFYAEGRDVTKAETLADLAAAVGFDHDAFFAALGDEELKEETWRDYAISQRAGVTGFPTLIVGPNADATYALVTKGYRSPEDVIGAVDVWLAGAKPQDA